MCRGAARIGRQNGTEFLFRGVGVSRGKLLPAAPKMCDGGIVRGIGSRRARRRCSRFNIGAKSCDIELGFDAIQARQGFVLPVQVNRREPVWTKSFVRR